MRQIPAKQRPLLLIIRDGWGENHNPDHDEFNALKLAQRPFTRGLSESCPRTELKACGLDVGLPEGVMGNSEVGHQNIGAGRIVDQELVRISRAFSEIPIREKPVLKQAFEIARGPGKLHFLGIASDAGVHGLLEHLFALLREAKLAGVEQAYIHAFTDGRDTSPFAGKAYLAAIETRCRELGIGAIASVCGRFWSMDRDNRWDRVSKAYKMLIGEEADHQARTAQEAIRHYYDHPLDNSRKGDEFVSPTWIVNQAGKPIAPIEDHDAVVFFNYRGDRPRELVRALTEDDFSGFQRTLRSPLYLVTMTNYQEGLCKNILFEKPPKMPNIMGLHLADLGVPQFRSAETEKYPHVTYFFNDYREEAFQAEDRILIPSPRVATYDLQPQMSAAGVTEAVLQAIDSEKYGFLLVNFANPDMVGHTGSLEAAIRAVSVVDQSLEVLLGALEKVGGVAVITADHGNCDQMWDPELGMPHTAHTLNPVELLIFGAGTESLRLRPEGRLADIAPTCLELMGLEMPKEMTGETLITG